MDVERYARVATIEEIIDNGWNLNIPRHEDTFEEEEEIDITDFLIADYRRPYAWEEKECQALWDDIFSFAFPKNGCDKIDRHNDDYLLGPIVTILNEDKKQEVIDGQQRLTTMVLLFRAFHARYENVKDDLSASVRKNIEQCVWKTDEYDKPDMNSLKLDCYCPRRSLINQLRCFLKLGTSEKCLPFGWSIEYRV